ncbi:MAG: hypothetical protein WCI22_13905 [Actinomycetota bacterium]
MRMLAGQVCVITSVALDLSVDLEAVYGTAGQLTTVRSTPLVLDSRPQMVSSSTPWRVPVAPPSSTKGLVLNIAVVHPVSDLKVTVAACGTSSVPPAQLMAVAARGAGMQVVVPFTSAGVCVRTSSTVAVVIEVEGFFS